MGDLQEEGGSTIILYSFIFERGKEKLSKDIGWFIRGGAAYTSEYGISLYVRCIGGKTQSYKITCIYNTYRTIRLFEKSILAGRVSTF